MICSYGPAHEVDVLAAIAAGKPVFCEKPLTPTADAALRIMEAEQAAGRRLVTVGFMRRFDRTYREMKALLDSGELGETLMVHCAHRNPTVPEHYTWDMAINDTAIHEIDTMRWLLGEEFVTGARRQAEEDLAALRAPAGPARPRPRDRVGRPRRRRDLRQLPVRLRHPLRGGRREGHGVLVRPGRGRRSATASGCATRSPATTTTASGARSSPRCRSGSTPSPAASTRDRRRGTGMPPRASATRASERSPTRHRRQGRDDREAGLLRLTAPLRSGDGDAGTRTPSQAGASEGCGPSVYRPVWPIA